MTRPVPIAAMMELVGRWVGVVEGAVFQSIKVIMVGSRCVGAYLFKITLQHKWLNWH